MMFKRTGTRQFPSWEFEFGPLLISRAPFGGRLTLWGYGVHVAHTLSTTRWSLARPLKPSDGLEEYGEF